MDDDKPVNVWIAFPRDMKPIPPGMHVLPITFRLSPDATENVAIRPDTGEIVRRWTSPKTQPDTE